MLASTDLLNYISLSESLQARIDTNLPADKVSLEGYSHIAKNDQPLGVLVDELCLWIASPLQESDHHKISCQFKEILLFGIL